MPVKELHVVSFGVPYPPVYGGAMDVYFRLQAFHKLGAKVHLHCFVYSGQQPGEELTPLCETITYYRRSFLRFWFRPYLPLLVSSRMSGRLLQNLNSLPLPVLMEGIHTSGWWQNISRERLFLRAHNVES